MARKGENIRKRKDGRWEGRYHVIENGISKTKSVYARSYRDVKVKLLEKQTLSITQEKRPVTSLSISQELILDKIATEWLLKSTMK